MAEPEPTPYGVPGATPTHAGGDEKKSPDDEAATSPPLTPEDKGPEGDVGAVAKRPSKRAKTQGELKSLIKAVKRIVTGLQTSTSTLDETNANLKKVDQEVRALATQRGCDQISSPYFLSSMTQHTNAMNNLLWQVSGGKSQSSTSLKEVALSMEDTLKKCCKTLEELKKEAR